MFRKLLKYEFKSQGKLLGLITASVLGASVLGGLLIWLLMSQVNLTNMEEGITAIFMILSFLFFIMLVFVIAAYSTAVSILLIYRFYKRHFSDEGYLTFTLPVSTHQLLLSHSAHYAIWSLISVLVAFVALACLFVPFIGGYIAIFHDMLLEFSPADAQMFKEGFAMMWEEMQFAWEQMLPKGYMALTIAALPVSILSSIVKPMAAFTIGAVLSKKHKLLVGIGIYFGLDMVLSMVFSFFNMYSQFADMAIMVSTGEMSMYTTLIVTIVLNLAIAVGGYFLTHHLMSKKLNLP